MPDSGSLACVLGIGRHDVQGQPGGRVRHLQRALRPDRSDIGLRQNAQDKVSWNCWETGTESGPAGGAPCDTAAYDANEVKTTTYQVAGMQTLVDAIRTAGATQPIMVGGLNFSNDLSQWATHAPNDPLNQEAASFHNYMGQSCDNVACWNSQVAPVAAGVPVVTGEFDEDNYLESKCVVKTPNGFDQRIHGMGRRSRRLLPGLGLAGALPG